FSGIVKDKTKTLENIIVDLKADWGFTQSINIKVFYYLLKMEYHFLKTEYHIVDELGIELIEILFKQPAVFSLPRIGVIYYNLSDSQISAFNFKKAKMYAGKAKD